MADVYWLEQTEEEVPVGDEWLSTSEQHRMNGLRFPKRRADWRLGRWTAKRALAAALHLPSNLSAFARIEIHALPSGAPEVRFDKPQNRVTISISHSNGSSICAVTHGSIALGCDQEKIEPRSNGFVRDYLAAEEQALVASLNPADRDDLITLLWSVKETVLKALHEGLRLDTRSVTVSFPEEPAARFHALAPRCTGDTWYPFHARCTNGRVFSGWWQKSGEFVRTLVADPAPNSPILLETPCSIPLPI